jgi:UDP-glucose 4-epimerase
MSSILVTGGAGFIGSHLVDRLLRENNWVTSISGHSDKVTVIDDFSMGKRENLPKHPRLKIVEASILADIGYLFKGIDIVFHLAALTKPTWSLLHIPETNHINIDGTVKILEHCRDYKIKRLVFVSSSAIYGEQKKYPTSEDAIPNPMNPYALTKLIGEQYCKLFQLMYGLESNYIRPFNVYGKRQSPVGEYGAAVPKFIDRINSIKNDIETGEIPFITGDGEQTRDFIYIDDAVDIMIRASKSKVFGRAFNAGSGKNISINKLYDKVTTIMNEKVKPFYADAIFEPRQTLADMTQVKKILGWKPKISLEEGLRRTING